MTISNDTAAAISITPRKPALLRSIGAPLDGELVVRTLEPHRHVVVHREVGRWVVVNDAALHALKSEADHGSAAPRPARTALLSAMGLGPREPRVARAEPGPLQLFVIYKLTHACNYSCTYCYDEPVRRKTDRRARDEAFRDLVARTLSEDGARLSVLFHGGEPLLELKTIREAVTHCEAAFPGRVSFSVQTNGSLLSSDAIDFFIDHKVGMSVSVDGVTADDNAQRVARGEDPYQKLLGTLRANPRMSPAFMGLNVTVGPQNVRRLPEIMLQMQADGFRSVSFTIFHPTAMADAPAPGSAGQATKTKLHVVGDDEVVWTPVLAAQSLLRLVDLAAEGRINALAMQYLIQTALRVQGEAAELTCLSSPCGAGRDVIALYPSGELGPCDTVVEPALFFDSLDAYREGQSGGSELFRQLLARDVDSVEPCRSCDVKRMCNGTCPGTALLVEGDLGQVHHFECAFNFELLRGLLDRLASPRYRGFVEYCRNHTQRRAELRAQLLEGMT